MNNNTTTLTKKQIEKSANLAGRRGRTVLSICEYFIPDGPRNGWHSCEFPANYDGFKLCFKQGATRLSFLMSDGAHRDYDISEVYNPNDKTNRFTETDVLTYDERVKAIEAGGLSRSDAQAIVDAEDLTADERIKKIIADVPNYLNPDELEYWNSAPATWKNDAARWIKHLGESCLFTDEIDYYPGFESLSEDIAHLLES